MKRIATKWAIIAAALAGLVVLIGALVYRPGAPPTMRVVSHCTDPASFCVSGPTSGSGPTLYPGAGSSPLQITFSNSTMPQTIHVQALTITFQDANGNTDFGASAATPNACLATDFTITGQNGAVVTSMTSTATTLMAKLDLTSNAITIGPGAQVVTDSTGTDGAPSIVALGIKDTSANQDGCKGIPLPMQYSATAGYTLETQTQLTPTSSGSTITLNAIVSPQDPPSATDSQFTPAGSVTFNLCTGAAPSPCSSSTPVGSPSTVSLASCSASATSETACASTTYTPPSSGTYTFFAQYNPGCSTSTVANTNCAGDPTDRPDFDKSNSESGTGGGQSTTVTGCSTVSTSTAGAYVISPANNNSPYNGNYEVKNGQTLLLEGGVIKGNVMVDAGGSFGVVNGTVTGNVQANGTASQPATVSLSGKATGQTYTVAGNVQSTNGGLSLGSGVYVKGNVQASGTGPFCSQGSSSSIVQIGGNLQVQSLAGNSNSPTANVCWNVIGGNLQWQQNAVPVDIGGCGTNTINGNLQVQNNSAALTVNGNNVTGNIQVQNNTNTAGSSVSGNKSGGNCQLQSNNSKITGGVPTANTAKGQDSCNGTG